MNESSPDAAPAAAPPPMPAGGLLEPAAVRVFGILHLILAGLGVLMSLWGFFSIVLPAMQRMMDDAIEMAPGMPPGTSDQFTGIMKTMMAVSSVATPLVSCLYPALALFFLSRPQVKEWAGQRRSGGA